MADYKILLAGDGSKPSFRAAETVREMMKWSPEVKVTVIMVFPAHEKADDTEEFSFVMHEGLKEMVEANMEKVAESYRNFFAEEGFEITVEKRFGDPAERIVRYAEKRNFDLIAVGKRGHKGFENIVLGSVAHKVIHISKIPVLVVR
ncbi:MAG: universal stress protein [Bacillota bacterium]